MVPIFLPTRQPFCIAGFLKRPNFGGGDSDLALQSANFSQRAGLKLPNFLNQTSDCLARLIRFSSSDLSFYGGAEFKNLRLTVAVEGFQVIK